MTHLERFICAFILFSLYVYSLHTLVEVKFGGQYTAKFSRAAEVYCDSLNQFIIPSVALNQIIRSQLTERKKKRW